MYAHLHRPNTDPIIDTNIPRRTRNPPNPLPPIAAYLLSYIDTAAVHGVDVLFALVHEATDEAVVTEDDAGHLSDVLVALVLADVGPVIHQAGHQEPLPPLLLVALFDLRTAGPNTHVNVTEHRAFCLIYNIFNISLKLSSKQTYNRLLKMAYWHVIPC